MFTGIIEEVGRIRAIERQAVSARLTVAASKVLSDVHLGDSIAVNGVCLTVTSTEPEPSGMCAGTEMPSGIRFRLQNRFCG